MSALVAYPLLHSGRLVLPLRKSAHDTTRGAQSTSIEVFQAQEQVHAPHIRELFWEYLQWANARLNEEYGIDFDIAAMIERDMAELHKFLPPRGRLLLGR